MHEMVGGMQDIVLTLILFVISHIITSVWWASKTSTLLDVVQRELKEMVSELKSMNKVMVSKEEVAREQAVNEKEHVAIWKNIDEIKERLNTL